MVQPFTNTHDDRIPIAFNRTGNNLAAFPLEHHALQEFRFLFCRKRASKRHAVFLQESLLGAFDPMDKIALVREQQQSGRIRIQAAHRLDTHCRKTVGHKFKDRAVVTGVMATFHIQRFIKHHVQLFFRRHFFAIHGDACGPFRKLNERVFYNLAVQFHEPHAHKRTRFFAGTETNRREQAIQSQSRHYSSTIQPTIFLRTKPSSGSSPVLSTCARRRQNDKKRTAT